MTVSRTFAALAVRAVGGAQPRGRRPDHDARMVGVGRRVPEAGEVLAAREHAAAAQARRERAARAADRLGGAAEGAGPEEARAGRGDVEDRREVEVDAGEAQLTTGALALAERARRVGAQVGGRRERRRPRQPPDGPALLIDRDQQPRVAAAHRRLLERRDRLHHLRGGARVVGEQDHAADLSAVHAPQEPPRRLQAGHPGDRSSGPRPVAAPGRRRSRRRGRAPLSRPAAASRRGGSPPWSASALQPMNPAAKPPTTSTSPRASQTRPARVSSFGSSGPPSRSATCRRPSAGRTCPTSHAAAAGRVGPQAHDARGRRAWPR